MWRSGREAKGHVDVRCWGVRTQGAGSKEMRGIVCKLWVYSDCGTWSMVGRNSPRGGPKIKHEWETWPWNARNRETYRVGMGGYALQLPYFETMGSDCLVPWGSGDVLPCTYLVSV